VGPNTSLGELELDPDSLEVRKPAGCSSSPERVVRLEVIAVAVLLGMFELIERGVLLIE
jgi:hypothetical protein